MCVPFEKYSLKCYRMALITALLNMLRHHQVYDILIFIAANLTGFS
jgi:hypothetical protein